MDLRLTLNLEVAAGLFELGEIVRRKREALASDYLALRHLKADVILSLEIGRPPGKAGASVVFKFRITRNPAGRRHLINPPRESIFIKTVVFNDEQHALADVAAHVRVVNLATNHGAVFERRHAIKLRFNHYTLGFGSFSIVRIVDRNCYRIAERHVTRCLTV